MLAQRLGLPTLSAGIVCCLLRYLIGGWGCCLLGWRKGWCPPCALLPCLLTCLLALVALLLASPHGRWSLLCARLRCFLNNYFLGRGWRPPPSPHFALLAWRLGLPFLRLVGGGARLVLASCPCVVPAWWQCLLPSMAGGQWCPPGARLLVMLAWRCHEKRWWAADVRKAHI